MGIIFPVIFFKIHFDEGTDLQQKQQLKVCWLCELNDMKNNLAEGLCHSKAYSVYGTLTKRNHEILCDPRRKLRLNVAALLMYYACTKRIYIIYDASLGSFSFCSISSRVCHQIKGRGNWLQIGMYN